MELDAKSLQLAPSHSGKNYILKFLDPNRDPTDTKIEWFVASEISRPSKNLIEFDSNFSIGKIC